jgi:penicillin-binding protein 2
MLTLTRRVTFSIPAVLMAVGMLASAKAQDAAAPDPPPLKEEGAPNPKAAPDQNGSDAQGSAEMVPDSISIPKFEDEGSETNTSAVLDDGTTSITGGMGEGDVAVEIPAELAPGAGQEEESKEEIQMAEGATVEEEVAIEDSIVKKIEEAPPSSVMISAKDILAKSQQINRDGEKSSLATRTEARTFTFSIPAPRGQLLDRNGYPLAQSRVAYYAAINFPFLGDEVSDAEVLRYAGERIVHVNRILETKWDLPGRTVINHYKDRRWVPLAFSSVLNDEQVDSMSRQQMEGLSLHPIYLRHYPQGKTLGHVVGYVGKRPPRLTGPIVNDEDMWRQGMGVDGLEKAFETDLRGKPGRTNVLFEADGSKVKEDVLSRPQPGYNVVTSIDLEMQRIAEDLLEEKVKRGAMVIMDCRTGDIMAMASNPSFDPNLFIPEISQEQYSALVEDPDKPLYARAFRAAYPPASTFKIPVALGFLESGYISAADVYPCPPAWQVGNVVMRNWSKDEEGYMNVVGAITRSCNTWFYEVATRAGADSMSYMATRLGLGQKTGIPLNENSGFIPSNRYWLDEYGYLMSDGEEAVMSIGQGKVETTPLQIARMMAAIGNGREVLKPRLVLQIQDLNHEIIRTFPTEVANNLQVDNYSLRSVQRGMYDVVNAGNGTGGRASHKITVSGKTGTGQWKIANKQNIAWFAGYFPSKYPVYSFAVIYEGEPGEKVGGSSKAAPVVGEFLKRYLTEDNYNEVRDAATRLKGLYGEPDEEFSYRGPVQSIFRDGPEGLPIEGELIPVPNDPTAIPQTSREGSGLFDGFFRKRRR